MSGWYVGWGSGWQAGIAAGSALALLLELAAGRPVFAEREYLLDGTGTVLAIYDLSDSTRTHVLTQADTAKQVLPPAPFGSEFNGRPCYSFDGISQYYVSNRPPSSFVSMHSGSGDGLVFVLTPTNVAGTRRAVGTRQAGSAVGMSLGWDGNTTCNVSYTNGAGVICAPSAVTIVADVPTYFQVAYLEGGGTPEAVLRKKGTAVSSVDSTGAPSGSDPVLSLSWGAFGNGTFHASFRSPMLLPQMPNHAANRPAIEAAIFSLYGLTA